MILVLVWLISWRLRAVFSFTTIPRASSYTSVFKLHGTKTSHLLQVILCHRGLAHLIRKQRIPRVVQHSIKFKLWYFSHSCAIIYQVSISIHIIYSSVLKTISDPPYNVLLTYNISGVIWIHTLNIYVCIVHVVCSITITFICYMTQWFTMHFSITYDLPAYLMQWYHTHT